jgi:hypothetical protein
MKSLIVALGLLASPFALAVEKTPAAEKGFSVEEVRVGKAVFKLPVPKAFVVVGRDEDWAKAFCARMESLSQDPRNGISFVFVSLTPEHLAQCREAKTLNTGLDCWGTVQNQLADRELDQAAFAKIADAVAAEFGKNGFDSVRKTIRREVKDEEFNRILGGLGNPMILDRNERSIQFIMPSGANLILGAYVLVEGKTFNIYLQAPKAEVREMLVRMDDWIAEIIKTTKAVRK